MEIKPTDTRKELLRASIVVGIIIVFAIFSISVNLVNTVYNLLKTYGSIAIAETLSNVILLSLYFLLWVAYRQWRRAEERRKTLQTIISSISPDVLLVVDVDRTIALCAGSMKNMFGYEEDEVVGQKTELLYSDRRLDPTRPHEIHEILERQGFHVGLATGKRKDGGKIPLEIVTGSLSGRQGAVLLVRDITERRRVEEALRESEAKYRTLFEESLEAKSLTREGKIVDVNPAWLEMHGFESKDEVLGMDIIKVVHPDNRQIFEGRRKTWSGDVRRIYELRDIRKDGTVIHVELYSNTLMLEGKEAILTTVRDISGRRERELRRPSDQPPQ